MMESARFWTNLTTTLPRSTRGRAARCTLRCPSRAEPSTASSPALSQDSSGCTGASPSGTRDGSRPPKSFCPPTPKRSTTRPPRAPSRTARSSSLSQRRRHPKPSHSSSRRTARKSGSMALAATSGSLSSPWTPTASESSSCRGRQSQPTGPSWTACVLSVRTSRPSPRAQGAARGSTLSCASTSSNSSPSAASPTTNPRISRTRRRASLSLSPLSTHATPRRAFGRVCASRLYREAAETATPFVSRFWTSCAATVSRRDTGLVSRTSSLRSGTRSCIPTAHPTISSSQRPTLTS
mmetsp:Transcript_3099/g.6221  ORF Transcript_3099/g.6221 Transcript_3099/m.6221 type:complete len:295 (-) Transcript_3099:794-1678(-)